MNILRTVQRSAVFLAFVFALANAALYWSRRPAPAEAGADETAWRALPEQRQEQMRSLLKPDGIANDPRAVLAARRFAALDPKYQERLRQLHKLYAATVATQPASWWRRFLQAEPAVRAIWVERAFEDGDPAILEQVRALYQDR